MRTKKTQTANPDRPALKALKTAIAAEKKSLSSYLQFGLRTDDQGGKNMFIRLALDEFEHLNILERQARSLRESADWLRIEIEPSLPEMIVPRLDEKDLRIRGTRGQDQLAALHSALALERRATDFYRAQARAATDSKAQEMFQRLAAMEEAHYELIEAEIDSIRQTGFWFGLREFSLEIE
ncbi:MAG: ferritin family protein [candidate division WOR-3 bacterium]